AESAGWKTFPRRAIRRVGRRASAAGRAAHRRMGRSRAERKGDHRHRVAVRSPQRSPAANDSARRAAGARIAVDGLVITASAAGNARSGQNPGRRPRRAGRSRALPAGAVLCSQYGRRYRFNRLHDDQIEEAMPSITTWTRLEPRSRSAEMNTSLQARIYDPLWMLARQWQLGEFQGEDNGPPVIARWRAEAARLTRYYAGAIASNTKLGAPF